MNKETRAKNGFYGKQELAWALSALESTLRWYREPASVTGHHQAGQAILF